MSIFEKRLALLIELSLAIEAGTATNGHRPGDSLSDTQFISVKIEWSGLSIPSGDFSDDFVAKYARLRSTSSTGESVKIAATDCTAGDLDKYFTRSKLWFSELVSGKRASTLIELHGKVWHVGFLFRSIRVGFIVRWCHELAVCSLDSS